MLLTASAAGTPALAVPARPSRPNIVWIVCHDIHATLLGCYGNTLARTPVIDDLARRGILYRNAFTTTPVCAPSRFSLVTGQFPQSWGPAENMRSVAHVRGLAASLPELMRKAGYFCTNNVFTDYNCDLEPQRIWNVCSITAHWRDRPAPTTPFFAVYNYSITHEHHLFATTPTVTDPASVVVPPYLPDTPEVRDSVARNVDMVNNQDAATAHLLGELRADGLEDDTIVFFVSDHGGVQPRTKRYCYESGLNVPLIVFVPQKFRHLARRDTDALISLVDMAPTTLALAGAPADPDMQGTPFLTPATLAPPARYVFSGRNRMDERLDLMRSVRDARFRYIRNYMPHRIYGQHNDYAWMARGYQSWEREWRAGRLNAVQSAFWREKPAEELYDVAADPHQLHNLAGDPAHRGKLDELAAALDAHMHRIDDNGFVAEGLSLPGRAESRARPGDLSRLLALTGRVIRRDPAHAAEFTTGLASDDEVVRYWSATGLLALRTRPAAATVAVGARFPSEPVPVIRALLAEILLVDGRDDGAIAWLGETAARTGRYTDSLAALTAATYAPPARTTVLAPVATRAAASAPPIPDAAALMGISATLAAADYLRLQLTGAYEPDSVVGPWKRQSPDAARQFALALGVPGPMGDPRI